MANEIKEIIMSAPIMTSAPIMSVAPITITNGEIIQYTVAIIIILLLAWFAIIKTLYPFWNLQPVLHPYDLFRHILLFGKPFIIWNNSDIPMSSKFIDHFQVSTIPYTAISETQKTDTLTLLRRKYIDSPNVLFNIDEHWLDNLVGIGHNQPGYISVPIAKGGCCVSYPIVLSNTFPNVPAANAYFMDLFTTDTISPTILFQTHEYNQRHANPLNGGNITFFKKEVAPHLGISPFIETATHLYSIPIARLRSVKGKLLPADIDLKLVSKNNGANAHFLMDFLTHIDKKVNLISVGFSTILNWIKVNYWFVFIAVQGEQIVAIYFFRDTRLQYEDYSDVDTNTKCIELICSYNNTDNDDVFYMGFIEAIKELSTKLNQDFRLIQIPDIGAGNGAILERWNMRNTAIMKTYLAFYFFNYCWKLNAKYKKKNVVGGDLLILV